MAQKRIYAVRIAADDGEFPDENELEVICEDTVGVFFFFFFFLFFKKKKKKGPSANIQKRDPR